MADEIDNAAALEELEREIALLNRSRDFLKFTGKCHYCEHPLSVGNFCDSGCRDDYELEKRQKAQRRHAA
ncbi:hypothetical protein [Rahnella laticis]|uniref:hypothetical protein n=1 Tax=Rahnella laticis TaxID=2787622 RepID=UPI0018A2BCC9|nr:hypothetical protein [Rahnella laticis]MBF7995235.1 hypothetical protein [Rahnella laticis]